MVNTVIGVRLPRRPSLMIALGATLLAAGAATAPVASAAAGSPFTVNSLLDTPDTKIDGNCATSTGVCTLRAALMEANAASGAAVINFNLPGTGVQTILPAAKLPSLTNPAGITIDGYTQPGASANTDPLVSNAQIRVELKGKGPGSFDGLVITTPNNTIRGLSIYNFWKQISVLGDPADNNTIAGDYLCTNATGTFGLTTVTPLSLGVLMQQGPSGNRVGTPALADRNVISGCGNRGVTFSFAPTTGNLVQNNIIGLTPSGTAARPNGSQGVDINYTYGNTVGGTGANQGNVLSGNWGSGIEVSHGRNTNNNVVVGNRIGTAPDGSVTAYSGNALWGIRFEGPKFCADPAHDNPGGCTEAQVVEGLPHDNSAVGNVIVSNKRGGILIDKGHHNVVVQGNWIGVTPTGVLGGNKVGGVLIQRGSYGMSVLQNTIAGNPVGVKISSTGFYPPGPEQRTYGNTVSQNVTYAGTAIQFLWSSSATMVQDNIQPPALTAGAGGSISGTACAGCTVEVFLAANKTGRMGKTYLTSVTANAAGVWSASTGQPANKPITVTATDATGNTSIFAIPVLTRA
ncbi:MAG: hypothetical protein U0Q21_09405 [Dermatophilaceae bacterium]